MRLMDADYITLEELAAAARLITRRHHGGQIDACAIQAAKVGRCSGNCAFCSQSAYHKCDVRDVEVDDVDVGEVLARAHELQTIGVGRFSLVTSGEHLRDDEFEPILSIYHKLHKETNLQLCASLGRLDDEKARRLLEVGVTRYHHNIETSRSHFPNICTTHSYDDKLETIRIAREAGMEICCGGIFAMGETPSQRLEMAYALRELDVACVPINILNPIPGTRLEGQPPLAVEEILRTVALFRFILPDKTLRFAGGRQRAMGKKEYAAYDMGLNGIMVGDFLTTKGMEAKQQMEKLKNRPIG